MNNNLLATHIIQIVEEYIQQYNKLIHDKFGLSTSELNPLWEKVIKSVDETEQSSITHPPTPSSVSHPPTPSSVSHPPTPSSITRSSSSVSHPPTPDKTLSNEKESIGCPYVFTKGAKEGKCCGSKPKGGNTYCSRHKKYEGQVQVSKKVILPSRRSIVSSTTKLTTKKNKQNIVLHKGPDGKHYHRPSGLVFNRDKVVIGTWLKACDNPEGVDEIIPLTDKDIEKAKKHMFAFQKEETDNVTLATRKVTKFLDPEAAKNLEQSLSNAIAETNAKADDVNDILCELQTKNSDSDSCAENVSDESECEYEDEEEELVEED